MVFELPLIFSNAVVMIEVIWLRNITTIISKITKIKIISTVPIPSSSCKNDLKFFILILISALHFNGSAPLRLCIKLVPGSAQAQYNSPSKTCDHSPSKPINTSLDSRTTYAVAQIDFGFKRSFGYHILRNAAYKIMTNTSASITAMGSNNFVPAFSPNSFASSFL